MKRLRGRAWTPLALIAALAVIPALALAAPKGPNILESTLKGKNVVGQPGAPNGSGKAIINSKGKANKVCYELSWKKVGGAAQGAVIRRGQTGANGPLAVTLLTGTQSGRNADGCSKKKKKGKPLTAKTIKKLKRKPQNFYVQIGSETYPDGAIRGQLEKP